MNNINTFPNLQRGEISITLKSISPINCFKDDKASSLRDKLQLTYNYVPLGLDKSFEENGISNGAVINLTTDQLYNAFFNTVDNNNNISLSLDGNCPVRELIKLYFKFTKREDLYQYQLVNHAIYMSFLFNASPLNIKDEQPTKHIFNNNYNPKIIVIDGGNIPGGNYPSLFLLSNKN